MSKNEIEYRRQEGGVACRRADVFGSKAAFGQELPEAGRIAGNVGEGLGGDRFGGFSGETVAFSSFYRHFHFRNK